MSDHVEYTEMVPVFFGSYVEAVALRSALEAHGFETFLPSENMKLTDPFITGPNGLNVQLEAPADVAGEVRGLIEELRPADTDERRSPAQVRRGWWFVILLMFGPLFLVLLAAKLVWRLTDFWFRRDRAGTPPGDVAAPGSSPAE